MEEGEGPEGGKGVLEERADAEREEHVLHLHRADEDTDDHIRAGDGYVDLVVRQALALVPVDSTQLAGGGAVGERDVGGAASAYLALFWKPL